MHPQTGIKDRADRQRLFVTGVLAAFTMITGMLILREFTATESLIEIVGEGVVQVVPMGLFSAMLSAFGGAAKQLVVVSIILGMLFVGGGIAQVDGGPARGLSMPRTIRRILGLSASIWVPLAIAAVILTTYGTVTPASNSELLSLVATLFFDALIFAVALYAFYPPVAGIQPSTRVDSPPADSSRRRLVAVGVISAATLASVGVTGRFIRGIRGGVIGGARGGLVQPVTSTEQFYVISKNFVDPTVDDGGWRLEISGLVERAQSFTYLDLQNMPHRDQLTTLSCISNEIGGDLISNAKWTGVPLGELLARAGVDPGAGELALYADDGYSESIPLSKALEADTMLAYLMNDEPLTRKHGFPTRLIVPGVYGIKNVKWITKIELSSGDFKGYWQQRGWTDDGTIQTLSRFDLPSSRAIVPQGAIELGGVAFAGNRGVRSVEISVNDGAWMPVDTVEQVAPLSWVIWRSTWNPAEPGTYALRVRAIDENGDIQTDARRNPIPDGATGYHAIDIGIT